MAASRNRNKGCLTLFFRALGIAPRNAQVADEFEDEEVAEKLPYHVRDRFLTPAELSFHHVLRSVVGERVAINSQVGLNSIFFTARPHENQSYRSKITQKTIDFLLCDPKTMQPIVGIELDDASHEQPARQERDEFVNKVFESAKLPLLHFSVRHAYNTREVALQLDSFINGLDAAAGDTAVSNPPLCPKCGVPMVERVAKQGEYQGRKFYGCVNYPRCREVIKIT